MVFSCVYVGVGVSECTSFICHLVVKEPSSVLKIVVTVNSMCFTIVRTAMFPFVLCVFHSEVYFRVFLSLVTPTDGFWKQEMTVRSHYIVTPNNSGAEKLIWNPWMGFSWLYYIPKLSNCLVQIAETYNVPMSASSLVTTILRNFPPLSLMLCLNHLLRVRYHRLLCSATENHHLSLEYHQTLGDLDPMVPFSRFKMIESLLVSCRVRTVLRSP